MLLIGSCWEEWEVTVFSFEGFCCILLPAVDKGNEGDMRLIFVFIDMVDMRATCLRCRDISAEYL